MACRYGRKKEATVSRLATPQLVLLAMTMTMPLAAAQPGREASSGAANAPAAVREAGRIPPAVTRGVAKGLHFPNVGPAAVPTPPAGTWGVVASGDAGGAVFRDTDSVAEAWLGSDGYGIQGFGDIAGGYFIGNSGGGYAYLGLVDSGVEGGGTFVGGYFFDIDGSGDVYLGYGDTGVAASGTVMGGTFSDNDSTGLAYLGYGDTGIEATGAVAGGSFSDSDSTGLAYVGYGDTGVQASGASSGGEFSDSDGTGHVYAGYGDTGVYGEGSEAGAAFSNTLTTAYATMALTDLDFGDVGIRAGGDDAAGYFESMLATGRAFLGVIDTGMEGYGDEAGGYFELTNSLAPPGTPPTASALVAYADEGIEAYGDYAGGYFEDTTSSAYAFVGSDTAKIEGTGSVNFVQNHPKDPGLVIVYTAPEGDEVATYTRGTARLQGGEARVPLGRTFAWVTDPDLGLTAYVTPVGDWCDLYVVSKGTDQLTVRSRDGSDCSFDYIVWGLRIGFEESTVVREKKQPAYIPSMTSHRDLAARRPDLAGYTALSRWTNQLTALGQGATIDLSSANALRDQIGEYDPAVYGKLERPGRSRVKASSSPADRAAARGEAVTRGEAGTSRVAPSKLAPADPGSPADLGMGSLPVQEDVYARSFRPSAGDLASLQDVSEQVEAGDVLAIDPDRPGRLRRAVSAADATVVGVVAAQPGVVLGSASEGDSSRAPVMFSGIALCKVDATYGPILPGDLLMTSPTAGRAMRADAASPGTVLGKALEEQREGQGTIRILVMAR